jgi:carboxypeptidase C (cathepsin A)
MALPVEKEWRQWLGRENQIAGWKKVYKGLTFMTVHGVGHMAPQWARYNSLWMVNDFIFVSS